MEVGGDKGRDRSKAWWGEGVLISIFSRWFILLRYSWGPLVPVGCKPRKLVGLKRCGWSKYSPGAGMLPSASTTPCSLAGGYHWMEDALMG